jgi:hypothetical protein
MSGRFCSLTAGRDSRMPGSSRKRTGLAESLCIERDERGFIGCGGGLMSNAGGRL